MRARDRARRAGDTAGALRRSVRAIAAREAQGHRRVELRARIEGAYARLLFEPEGAARDLSGRRGGRASRRSRRSRRQIAGARLAADWLCPRRDPWRPRGLGGSREACARLLPQHAFPPCDCIQRDRRGDVLGADGRGAGDREVHALLAEDAITASDVQRSFRSSAVSTRRQESSRRHAGSSPRRTALSRTSVPATGMVICGTVVQTSSYSPATWSQRRGRYANSANTSSARTIGRTWLSGLPSSPRRSTGKDASRKPSIGSPFPARTRQAMT